MQEVHGLPCGEQHTWAVRPYDLTEAYQCPKCQVGWSVGKSCACQQVGRHPELANQWANPTPAVEVSAQSKKGAWPG